jgi:hypothetical protein
MREERGAGRVGRGRSPMGSLRIYLFDRCFFDGLNRLRRRGDWFGSLSGGPLSSSHRWSDVH